MTVASIIVDFKAPPPSGRTKVLFRCQPQDLAVIDKVASIMFMSREQFVRTVLLATAQQMIGQLTESEVQEPVSRKSSAKFDPSKPPGM